MLIAQIPGAPELPAIPSGNDPLVLLVGMTLFGIVGALLLIYLVVNMLSSDDESSSAES